MLICNLVPIEKSQLQIKRAVYFLQDFEVRQ